MGLYHRSCSKALIKISLSPFSQSPDCAQWTFGANFPISLPSAAQRPAIMLIHMWRSLRSSCQRSDVSVTSLLRIRSTRLIRHFPLQPWSLQVSDSTRVCCKISRRKLLLSVCPSRKYCHSAAATTLASHRDKFSAQKQVTPSSPLNVLVCSHFQSAHSPLAASSSFTASRV